MIHLRLVVGCSNANEPIVFECDDSSTSSVDLTKLIAPLTLISSLFPSDVHAMASEKFAELCNGLVD